MNPVLPMLAAALTTDVKATVHRTKRNVAIYAVAFLAMLTAYVAAVVAAALHAAAAFGPLAAAWLVAAIALATGILLIAAVAILNRLDRRRQAASADPGTKMMAVAAMALLPTLLRSRALPVLAVAGAAGIAAGYAIKGRSQDQ